MTNSIASISHQICTGCKMCADFCPKQAISFEESEGFWIPKVDMGKCVSCGLCSKLCPSLNEPQPTPKAPVSCYGAKSKDEDIRFNSTSGGVFSVLAQRWIEEGGVCYGAVYGSDMLVRHASCNTKQGVDALRQSKYVQSDTQGIYAAVKDDLQSNIRVMFCGTPCQVEALKAYLHKPYDGLFTMDFFCLGVCSPLVYRRYIEGLENRYGSKAVKVWFKHKRKGWRSIGVSVRFANGREYFRTGSNDLFMRAFVGDFLSLRPSCAHCHYRKIPHCSDLTLADFWGIEYVNPEMDDNMGLSAVLVNTEKGRKLFASVTDKLDSFVTDVESVIRHNDSALHAKPPHPDNERFITYLNTHSLKEAMEKYGSSMNKLKSKWRKAKRMVKALFGHKSGPNRATYSSHN